MRRVGVAAAWWSRRLGAPAGRHEVRGQLAAEVRPPDLATVALRGAERRVQRGEELVEVPEIPQEEHLRLTVVRGPDDLREVDHDWPIPAEEHVVGREIAMDEIAGEHPDHLRPQDRVQVCRLLRPERRVDQPGRRSAVRVHDQLHEQDALVEEDGPWHVKARRVQPVQRVGLLRLPRIFGCGSPEAAAAVHRSLGPRAPDLPPLLVRSVVLEAPGLPGPVDLGGYHLTCVPNQPDVSLLAALEARHDLVDNAVREERIERADHSDAQE
jgi:hypothetical protein